MFAEELNTIAQKMADYDMERQVCRSSCGKLLDVKIYSHVWPSQHIAVKLSRNVGHAIRIERVKL